jgi:F-type H+-transporting ATPase subunit delta
VKSSKVAKRYARALLGLSNDQVQLEIWGTELERLAGVVETSDIQAAFASPEVSALAKIQALALIAEKLDLSFPVRSFAAVIARHGRIPDISATADVYQQMLDDLMGRARATLTFPSPPKDADLKRIVAQLEALAHKKIIPTVKVDGSILGGVIAELEGKTYDGSLATRLAEAQHLLAG